jgi:type I restriction enzyme R subunit
VSELTPEKRARQFIDAQLAVDRTGVGVVEAKKAGAKLSIVAEQFATNLSIEPGDFEHAPFSLRFELVKAHQLFGQELPTLLDELNTALPA